MVSSSLNLLPASPRSISKLQPPYLKSSDPPGSSTTPSSEMNSVMTIFPIGAFPLEVDDVFNLSVEYNRRRRGHRSAQHHLRGTRRPDPASHPRSPLRRRRGDGQRAGRAVSDYGAGRVETPQGPGASRPHHPRPRRAAQAVAARRRSARRRRAVARRLPQVLGRELRPARVAAAGGRVTEDGFTISRVFDAPRERVWREWTEPERFADWYGGPEGVIPLDTVEMDVRPGGTWRATMYFGSDRREIRWRGEYREVEPPHRLVLTLTDRAGE